MKCIRKHFKKLRLLKKYKPAQAKMLDDIRLQQLMRDDMEFRRYHSHIRICELRCYNRLKKL